MRKLVLVAVLTLHAAAAFADGHPVTLWEVKGERNSVYLLGSIHLLRSQDYPLPSAIYAAYDDAEALVMEIDMDDLDPLAAQMAFNTYGVLKGDTTLQDLMGAQLYEEASNAAAKIDIPLEMLSKTDPWYAAMTIEMMVLSRLGFDPTLGIEMHIMSRATADNKEIDGFETVEEQVLFLDGMSLPAQREMLMSTLQEAAKIDGMMDDMIEAWRHGDTKFFESNMLDEIAKHVELNAALVTDRNSRWVTRIIEMLDDTDDYLVIVGALHLVGFDGVPKQLQRQGFDVQQLSQPPTVR